ncbi:hypothetical protein TNCV_2015221 [Trichonephila clavipes]|nr:hypothetical protein TNCV_2015221 [Trichonephila clavipes]
MHTVAKLVHTVAISVSRNGPNLIWHRLELAWKIDAGKSIHGASSICHISSTVVSRQQWRSSLSATHKQRLSMARGVENVLARTTVKHPLSRGRSGDDEQHAILCYLAEKCRLRGLEDTAQPPAFRSEKCNAGST